MRRRFPPVIIVFNFRTFYRVAILIHHSSVKKNVSRTNALGKDLGGDTRRRLHSRFHLGRKSRIRLLIVEQKSEAPND